MELTPLSITDQESISEAVYRLVSKYPELPFKATESTVRWQALGAGDSIGLFTMAGAVYLRRYVSGSYIGQFPFRIVYKCNPTTSRDRMDSQELLEALSAWLEQCSASLKDGNIEIQSIQRTSLIYKTEADDSGSEQYTCTLNVRYYFRR